MAAIGTLTVRELIAAAERTSLGVAADIEAAVTEICDCRLTGEPMSEDAMKFLDLLALNGLDLVDRERLFIFCRLGRTRDGHVCLEVGREI